MNRILDAANVNRGDGRWMNGVDYDSFACVLSSKIDEICGTDGESKPLSGPGISEEGVLSEAYEEISGGGGDAPVFAVSTFFRSRLLCSREQQMDLATDAIDVEMEKALGLTLMEGQVNSDLHFKSSDIETIDALSTDAESLVAALKRLWTKSVGIDKTNTLIHVGLGRVLAGADIFGPSDLLSGVAGKVVTNPKYDDDLLVVTGPINVNISNVETIESVNSETNRGLVFASALGSYTFDPCQAVRVSTLN